VIMWLQTTIEFSRNRKHRARNFVHNMIVYLQ
jgi:hypothetical protein